IRCSCPASVFRHLPLSTSHILTFLSSPPLASSEPSGLNVMDKIQLIRSPACSACKVFRCSQVVVSHKQMVSSSLLLASNLPSGLNATQRTPFLCCFRIARQVPVLLFHTRIV